MSSMPPDLSEAAADFWHEVTGRYLLGVAGALLLEETCRAITVADRRAQDGAPADELHEQRRHVDEMKASLNLRATPLRLRQPDDRRGGSA